jgi:uncharacterized protein YbaR (Trm112 family)
MIMPSKIDFNEVLRQLKLYVVCPMCKKESIVLLTYKQYHEYVKFVKGDLHIQDALPEMSADDRELLLTGICKECYDAID